MNAGTMSRISAQVPAFSAHAGPRQFGVKTTDLKITNNSHTLFMLGWCRR